MSIFTGGATISLELLIKFSKNADEIIDIVKQADKSKFPKQQIDEVVEEIQDLKSQVNNIIKVRMAKKLWDDFSYDDLLKFPPEKKLCFLAKTLVKTENGLKPIEKIQKGDFVYSKSIKSGEIELKIVLNVFNNVAEKYLSITLSNNEEINVTGQHLFWIQNLKRWIPACELNVGMKLGSTDLSDVTIQNIEIINNVEKTYNIEVADNHNYYVGNIGYLVHNSGKVSRFEKLDIIDVRFYEFFGEFNQPLYVGQSVQELLDRAAQHGYDFKQNPAKKTWMKDMDGFKEIRINGVKGPFRMTHFEAAVTESYELNKRGGKMNLGNKVNPISRTKFDKFKALGTFNPCKFYV